MAYAIVTKNGKVRHLYKDKPLEDELKYWDDPLGTCWQDIPHKIIELVERKG